PLHELFAEPADEVARFLHASARSGQFILGSLTLAPAGKEQIPCRGEGAALRPRTAEAPAQVLLRLTPKGHEQNQFLKLTRRVDELSEEIVRRKRVEGVLAEEVHRKDHFLAVLAHELRNPLAPMRNTLHVLDQPDVPSAMREQALRIMSRQVQLTARLLDDLLDLSLVNEGRLRL